MRLWPRRGPLLREPDFLRLWAAQAVSAVGARITRTALPVIAVLAVDARPSDLGILAAIALGPSVLISLAIGGVVDRSRKRPILVTADLVRAAAVFSLPLAAWLGGLGMAQLYVVAAVVGIATAAFQIADNAYLPALVGKEHLVAANATIEATEAVAEIGGPSLAGLLIQVLTAPFAMVIDALSYVVSAVLLGSIRKPEVPAAVEESPSVWRDIALGFGVSWSHPLVRPLLLATAMATFSGGSFAALYMLYVLDELGLHVGTVGVVIAMGGVGSLFGALLSGPITRRIGLGPALLLLLAVAEGSGLLIPAASGSTWTVLIILFAHQLLGDGCSVAWVIQAVSLRQRVLPLEVLGRSNAAFQAVTGAALPIGALATGYLGDQVGVRSALWISMSSALIAPLLLLPLWRLRASQGPAEPEASPLAAGPAAAAPVELAGPAAAPEPAAPDPAAPDPAVADAGSGSHPARRPGR
jgi:MFS family permease